MRKEKEEGVRLRGRKGSLTVLAPLLRSLHCRMDFFSLAIAVLKKTLFNEDKESRKYNKYINIH